MDLLEQFKGFLFSQDNKASKITVKNYISDINHFMRWYEKSSGKSFLPSDVKKNTIDSFKAENSSLLSPSSLERHLSSLRKFFSFLKIEGKISSNPFKVILNPSSEPSDPLKIKDFKNYLYLSNASHLTIKNYLIDIKQFLSWAEEVIVAREAVDSIDSNVLNHINSDLIDEYKKRLLTQAVFSPATINRKLSSLRKYFTWLSSEKLIRPFSFETSNIQAVKADPINLPVKNEDAVQAKQVEKAREYSKFPPLRLFQKASDAIILALDATLIAHLATAAEASQHLLWGLKGNPIFSKANKIRISKPVSLEQLVGVKNLPKELYAPLEISTKYFPWYKKLWHTLRYRRPKWYATYHSYAITHYFHFAVLLIFIVGLGIAFYNGFGGKNQSPTLAANLPTGPNRVLSFQGRLTDSSDNPITTPTNIRFSIYRDGGTATGAGILLWQEVDQVSPDTDGIFNSLLGNTTTSCGSPTSVALSACSIPSTLFSENNGIFLGVTIERTPELTPRQPIATVAFASNSETLQGLLPITATSAGTTNVVLALDSSGNLTIGGTGTPTFQATGGQFTLSGQTLLLTTKASSNSNVQIAPDGLGTIDLQKPLTNSTINNNISTALGSVEVDDLFSVLATSSGQSAVTINQNGLGPIFSASASGLSRFVINSLGTVATASVSGKTSYSALVVNNDLVAGDLFTASSSSQSRFTIKGNGQLVANAYQTCTIKTDSTGLFTCGTDNTGGGGFESPFTHSLGAIVPLNSTEDFLIGGQSSTSAKFAILNVNATRGTQTASLSGSLTLDSATAGIQSTNNQFLIIGGNTTGDIQFKPGNSSSSLYLSASGNVGIGTLAPDSPLVVNGNVKASTFKATTDGSASAPSYFFNNENQLGLFRPGSGTIAFASGGFENMRIVNGFVGISTTNPLATLDVRPVRAGGGTIAIASFSGQTSFAALAVDNSGVGDLFVASKSGALRFLISANGAITDTAYQNNGGLLFTSTTGLIGQTGIGNSGDCLKSIGGGTPAFSTCGTGGDRSPFSELAGAIVANNTTEDFLLGSQATVSARFRVTANIQGAGTLGVASVSGKTSYAAMVVNNDGVGDLFTASASGWTRFVITNQGFVGIGTNNPQAPLDIAGSTAVISNTTGDLTLSPAGNLVLTTAGGHGLSVSNGVGTNTQCLLGSTTPAWGSCGSGTSPFFDTGLGAIAENISTEDLLLGGNSTQSATFHFFGSNKLAGTQTVASIAAQTSFAAFVIDNKGVGDLFTASKSGAPRFTIAGNGAITANAYSTCTLKTDTTGLVTCGTDNTGSGGDRSPFSELAGAIVANNTTADFLLGSQSSVSARFKVTANIQGAGTLSVASVSGKTSFAAFVVNNDGVGDLFTASSSSISSFVIKGNGSVGIGTNNPTTALDVRGTITTAGNVAFSGTNPSITNTGANTLTLNSGSTGNLQFFSSSNTIDQNGNLSLAGTTGITLSGAGADLNFTGSASNFSSITTANNNNFAIIPGGSGLIGLNVGSNTLLSSLDIRSNSVAGGTISVASVSGRTSFATFVIDNSGAGDLFTASVSGGTRFTIKGNGSIIANAYQTCTLKTDNTGLITCGTDNTGGGGGGNSPFSEIAGGIIVPNNTTEDFLLGGQSTASARFHFYGTTPGQSTTPVASISANTLYAAFVIDNQNKFGDLFTASASGATRFVITNQGNVGIGIANPQAKLDIAGATSTISNTSGDITIDPTGNLIINSTNAGGSFGFNVTTPLSSFDIRENGTAGGTISIASVSGRTSFASLVANNDGLGDIFAASASGTTRFKIAQNGSLFQGQTLSSVGQGGTAFTSGAVANGIGDQGSLVPNASFESFVGGIGIADGWVAAASNGATQVISRVSTASAHGDDSIQVKLNASQSTAFYSTCIPIQLSTANPYNLGFTVKGTTSSPTVKGYLDTYASKLNCMNNNTPTFGTTTLGAVTTAYAAPVSAITTSAGTNTWGRIHIFVGCPATCATGVIINIDAIKFTNAAITAGLDYAENYPADPNNLAEPGDVVSIQSGGLIAQVKPTDKAADDSVIGIVSTQPGQVLDDGTVPDPKVAVALAGRVPVKVSLANGPIHTGDMLQSSTVPGVAVKAIRAGPIIGVADEEFTKDNVVEQYYKLTGGLWSKVFSCDIESPSCVGVGKIIANIKMSYYDPSPMIASIEDTILKDTDPNASFTAPHYYTLNDRLGNPLSKIDAYLSLVVGNLKAGFISAQQISTNALSVTSENISINGVGIRAYIASIVSDVIDNLNGTYLSPIASVDQIHTNLISPLDNSSNISLDLADSKLTIRNGKSASSSAVASIDNQGNATFSGTLNVGKDATIAGTLHASKIIADEIEGLNIKSATIAANYITNNNITNVYNSTASSFPTLSASPASSYSGSSIFGNLFASNNSFINIATYSSQLAYVQNFAASNAEITNGLMVFGPTSLSDTSIVGQLSVNGSLILANNSINTLGSDLNLQPLRQGGLSIMAGLIYIDTNGNIKIKGDATINGTLYANVISPIPNNDLSIKLPYDEDSSSNPSVKVKGASGSAVLSVNGLGDLIASGEATFGKLNISNLVSDALAVSPTEVVATGSAGTGFINPHQTLMTIDNKLVTKNSLIYITPTSNTNNQVLFLLRQVPNKSFTVGVQNLSNIQIPFNWIIIN